MSICVGCNRSFRATSGLLMHWNHNESCQKVALNVAAQQQDSTKVVEKNTFQTSKSITKDKLIDNLLDDIEYDNNMFEKNSFENFTTFQDDHDTEDDDLNDVGRYINSEKDLELMIKYINFKENKEDLLPTTNSEYKTNVDLLHILKTCNTPLYMFDKIMNWARKATWVHKFEFLATEISTREKFIESLKKQFDYSSLEPTTFELTLPGSKSKVNMVLHDFKQCFYSLLSDSQLMDENNLLIDPDDIFGIPLSKQSQKYISDVNTGDAWRLAHKLYVKSDMSELLCPIIFFIDKTHTDLNGRLCIEQIRFTLGIFKQHIRNQSRSWRTLGYVLDQNQICTNTSKNKMQDYQAMTAQILISLKDAQRSAIGWNLILKEKTVKVFFRVPILFIIGDTDGHDKLVGKFANRTNKVSRICRYCDCPFNETDDPFYSFKLNKKKDIEKLLSNNKAVELKDMSFHCIPNAWSDLLFCDNLHGIYGATPAELMHCLQKGLYEYVVKGLFSVKKLKKNSNKRKKTDIRKENLESNRELKSRNTDNDMDEEALVDNTTIPGESIVLSRNRVFTDKYGKSFDRITRRYGKHLMHQSNRELPRTHFYTNYTSTGYKNASELSGMLIVFLMVFSTKEGEGMIDNILGEERTSQWIHLFELLLMLENFCKSEKHLVRNIHVFKKMLPSILAYYKDTVNRLEGNGMKIIKFHLPLHFADDMLRFGSMSNYDSSIGELHHKDFAKKPSKNTQRRKEIFELQTANCQINNLTIDRAYDFVYPGARYETKNTENEPTMNKNNILEFCDKINNIVYTNGSKTSRPLCNWNDQIFMDQLVNECRDAINMGNLKAPIQFFTQYNRNGIIYRADPQFHKKSKQPWYDWVKVNWGEDNNNSCPAKLLIFMVVSDLDFCKPFKFGGSYIESPGSYALAYSVNENVVEQAHQNSMLVTYGKILTNENQPILYVLDVNSIVDTCVAVPYFPKDTVITATEWLFLKSKNEWYNLFIDHLNEKLNET